MKDYSGLIITQEVTSFLISNDIRDMDEALTILEIIVKKEDEVDPLPREVQMTGA